MARISAIRSVPVPIVEIPEPVDTACSRSGGRRGAWPGELGFYLCVCLIKGVHECEDAHTSRRTPSDINPRSLTGLELSTSPRLAHQGGPGSPPVSAFPALRL